MHKTAGNSIPFPLRFSGAVWNRDPAATAKINWAIPAKHNIAEERKRRPRFYSIPQLASLIKTKRSLRCSSRSSFWIV
jgi:hypothetical protein